ncbi:hypothetical protein TNCV_1088051 [Trichonephila clavipes]|uniref:Uncharacterized protein n=1 Tax=Trichonephila clavipes TaxID=2585209 RepID=A0A8X6VL46_TRICX|nr:hypothetical protein TNCV_1088051 [Trichonephila clavipes]
MALVLFDFEKYIKRSDRAFYTDESQSELQCCYCFSKSESVTSVVHNVRNVPGSLDIKSQQRDRAAWDQNG